MDLRVDRRSRRLEAALSGSAEVSAELVRLAHLAAELRDVGLRTPTAAPSTAGREELRAAVLAQADANNRPGIVARFRGATFVVAGLAGGGLVVASAASGSNPVVLVADAARELPRLTGHSAPADVSLEGEVLTSEDGGRTLQVRVGDDTLTIEPPKESRDVVSQGTPVAAAAIGAGTTVRVTAERESKTAVVAAKKIEVLSPSTSTVAARPAEPTRSPSLAAAQPTRDTTAATATNTPRPAPATLAANEPVPTSSSADPLQTRTPTPRPTATPTASPTPVPTKPASVAPNANETSDITPDEDDEGEIANRLR